jgi:hypothetical protein
MKKVIRIALFVFICIATASFNCRANEADEIETQRNGGALAGAKVNWHISLGYAVFNEMDISGGVVLGVGGEYKMGKDIVLIDVLFSPTNSKLDYPNWNGKIRNTILQLGYMTNFGKWDRTRIGFGVQIHQMNFVGTTRRTKAVLTGLAEHDFNRSLSFRLQSALSQKNDNIRFGNKVLFMLNWNFGPKVVSK